MAPVVTPTLNEHISRCRAWIEKQFVMIHYAFEFNRTSFGQATRDKIILWYEKSSLLSWYENSDTNSDV